MTTPNGRDELALASTTQGEGAPSIEERLRAVHVGPLAPLNGKINLAPYAEEWPRQYAAEAAKIQAALGDKALQIEHAGSTSVPRLDAKPIIDIILVVARPEDEADYVPALESASYALHIREPDWYQHRVLKGASPAVNLHVFGPDCEEVQRMLLFRDWLRREPGDRARYLRAKRELAQRDWTYAQEYADAKSTVVQAIIARATAALNGETK
jgi:GrpB-like predicted nucleotidyltransferase (UPF0157 family)